MIVQPGEHLLSIDVAQRLEAFVQEGGYLPGDKLPSERELALKFGVSRTAIREGIKYLTQSGLLQSSVGRGLFVKEFDTAPVLASLNTQLRLGAGTLLDVVQVRTVLETLAVTLAAERATDEELQELSLLVDEMAELQAAGESFGLSGGPGQKFHLAMGRASHNPLLAALLEPAMALSTGSERHNLPAMPGTLRGVESHRRILKALQDRDANAAVEAIQAHCQLLMELRDERDPNWETITFGSTRASRR